MADTRNGPQLHPVTEELANGKNFAAVTTVLPSGRLQTQMLWVGLKEASWSSTPRPTVGATRTSRRTPGSRS